jgi:tetratricopeptide (TPR) repeat protein
MATDTPFTTDDIDSLVESVRVAVAFGDTEAAFRLADTVLAMSPEHLEPLLIKATALGELGRPHDARAVLESAAAHHGDIAGVWQRLGDVALECGDGERAVEAYRLWQRLGGPAPAAETALAVACLVDLDPERARRHLVAARAAGGTELTAEVSKLLEDLGDRADVEAAAGWWLYSLGALGPAIERLSASLDHREQPGTHRLLGVALLAHQRGDEAVRHLEAAVDQAPDESAWRLDLGMAQLATGRIDAASESFAAVLAERPDDLAALVGTGRVAISRKDPAGALRVADALLDRDEGTAEAWTLRAEAFAIEDRHLEALVSAEHAIAATPDERSPWILAADAAAAANRPAVAAWYRGRAMIQLSGDLGIADGPDDATADLDAELHELDRLVVADPRIRSIYAHRAVIADWLFLPGRALGYLDAALERGVVDVTADVECDRGDLMSAIGDVDGAAKAFDRALAMDQRCERARVGRRRLADTGQPTLASHTTGSATQTMATTAAWAPTHQAPPTGVAAYATPESTQSPVANLDGGLLLERLDTTGTWTHVRCENGWECWVETRLLVPLGTPWTPSHRVPATGLIAYLAPSSTPEATGRIDAGLRVELIGEYGGWAHVRFENDWSCWVNRAALEELA